MKQEPLFPREKGHIGTDESGKGDYFGPLVTAGVFIPEGQDEVLKEMGVRDSKRISDNKVRDLAEQIKSGYLHSVVAVGPERYNALYEKMRNLNKLLAWTHARVIENILDEVNCGQVVTDQFGDELFVRNALMRKGKDIELIQRTKAEDDPAVAAASILARAEFLKRLFFLGKDAGIELPKGASPMVEEAAVQLVRTHGPHILFKYAKTHFKTTKRVLEAAG